MNQPRLQTISIDCERVEVEFKDSHEHAEEVYKELLKNGKDSILMYGHWDMKLVKNKRFIFLQEDGKTIVIPFHDKIKKKYGISIKDECIEINNLEVFRYCEERISSKISKPEEKVYISHFPVYYWNGKIGKNKFDLNISSEVIQNQDHEAVKFIKFMEEYIEKENLNKGFFKDNEKLLKKKKSGGK